MRVLAFAGLAATMLFGASSGAEAKANDVSARPFMPLGMTVDAPRGYTDMCRIRTQLCLNEDPRGKVQLASRATGAGDASAAAIAPVEAALQTVSAPRETFAAPALLQRADATSSISVNLLMDAGFVRPAFLRRAFVEPTFLRTPGAPGAPTVSTPPISTPALPAENAPAVVRNDEPEVMSTAARRKMLDQVNRVVNGRVRAVTDIALYGVDELWNRTGMERGAAGDCEDFAIEKREQLIARGYPTQDLFFAVAFRADLGLHAVLVAHTDDGDFVLDNRSAYVTPWTKVPYIWVKRQSQDDPMRWGLVDDSVPASPPAPRVREAREVQVAALSPELVPASAWAGQ